MCKQQQIIDAMQRERPGRWTWQDTLYIVIALTISISLFVAALFCTGCREVTDMIQHERHKEILDVAIPAAREVAREEASAAIAEAHAQNVKDRQVTEGRWRERITWLAGLFGLGAAGTGGAVYAHSRGETKAKRNREATA